MIVFQVSYWICKEITVVKKFHCWIWKSKIEVTEFKDFEINYQGLSEKMTLVLANVVRDKPVYKQNRVMDMHV